MARQLRNLKLDRIDLVDAPANPSSHVVLVKRNVAKEQPSAGDGHVDRPDWRDAEKAAIESAKATKRPLSRSGTVKKSILKRLMAVIKDAEAEAAWQDSGGGDGDGAADKPEAAGAYDSLPSMKAAHADLGKAIDSFGDQSKLPNDHPVHKLKALHKEMGDRIAEADARSQKSKEADASAREKEAEAEAEAEAMAAGGGAVGKFVKGLFAKTNNEIVELRKSTQAAEARATAAETIAKAQQDVRDLDDIKVALRKFDRLALNVDELAPKYLAQKRASAEAYAATLEQLAAANARLAKVDVLVQEIGSNRGGDGVGTAWAEIEQEADKLIAKDAKGMSKHKAIDVVMKKRPDLVTKHYAEQRPH